MKLLTFMQLAETKSEITFGEIQQFMQLGENEVEEFLIDRESFYILHLSIDPFIYLFTKHGSLSVVRVARIFLSLALGRSGPDP